MKAKTSITLSKELLASIDEYVKEDNNRSAFIELAVRTYLSILNRQKRDRHDLEIINTLAVRLNKEALEVLGYQAET